VADKKTILIVINNLGKGGAEVLLIGILPELNQRYNVVLVTLTDRCEFAADEIICSKRYVLGFAGPLSIIQCAGRLRRIIKHHQPDFIHAHLVYSSLIARIACPSNISLAYSVHDTIGTSVFKKSRVLYFLEKCTVSKDHFLIAVSDEVLLDYRKYIKETSNQFVLPNYIGDAFISAAKAPVHTGHFSRMRLVAVGNVKAQKNYPYLISALKQLKDPSVSLDIYGQSSSSLKETLQQEITAHQLPVVFKGRADDIYECLRSYDIYVMASSHEGFGVAVVEAMAIGLPLLLSDLPVLRSVTFGNALFFDISDPNFFIERIRELQEKKYDLQLLSTTGIALAKEHYTKEAYLQKLFTIYSKIEGWQHTRRK
jgi:glycosyltransferase involved in cell wall biosynthesis